MGLLNQILGGLAGNALGRSPLGHAFGGGSGRAVMALLPVVLGMLGSRRRGGLPGGGIPGFGEGGGMGSLGGLAGMGGLGGLLERFSQKGYGQEANSWISTGSNLPLRPEAVSDVLGQEQVAQIASQAGVSEDEARTGLAELLPEVVDHFTPNGQIPEQEQLLASIDEYDNHLSP